jgi:hypothetical protein
MPRAKTETVTSPTTNDPRATRRKQLLDLIESWKLGKRSQSKPKFQAWLAELAALDDKKFCPPWIPQCRTDQKHVGAYEHGHHFAPTEAGHSINGELVPIQQPFTADDIDARLGWVEPGEDVRKCFEQNFHEAGEALHRVILWLASGSQRSLECFGLRAVSLIQSCAPYLLHECGETTAAATARKMGITRAAVQKTQRKIRENLTDNRFSFVGAQSESARETGRARAIKQHIKAGHTIHQQQEREGVEA